MPIIWSSVVSFHNSHVSSCCLFTAAPCLHAVVTYAGLVEGDRYDLPLRTAGQPAITTRDCQETVGQANLRDYVNRKFCNYSNCKRFTFLHWPWNHKRHRPGGLAPCFLRWGRVAGHLTAANVVHWEHHELYGRNDSWRHSFSYSALDKGEWSFSHPGRFIPWEKPVLHTENRTGWLSRCKINTKSPGNHQRSSSSSSSYSCHAVGPLVDAFRSHVSRSLFKGLPWFLLPVGQ